MDKFMSLVCRYQFCMAEAISQNGMEQWKSNSYDLHRLYTRPMHTYIGCLTSLLSGL